MKIRINVPEVREALVDASARVAMGVRLLTFTAAAGASDAVLARLDALGAEKAGRWRTHAVFLHPRNEAQGLSDLFMVRLDTPGWGSGWGWASG